MLEEQARKDEERQQLQVRTEEERRTWEQEVQEKAHKLHVENLQQENDRVRKEIEEKWRLAEKIPKVTEADQPHTYFCRFEESMKEADIANKEWPLQLLLTGKALSAYTHEVSEEAKENYDA